MAFAYRTRQSRLLARFFPVAELEFYPATRRLDFDAVLAIYFQDQRVTMEQLGQLLDAAKRKDQSIIIKADRSASYETVAKVTNAALEHGITSVALAATPPR